MKFAKENLNLETALDKEWIITNGIGGFASSTIIGANTRKYHGLLVVPIIPPARRRLILSKLDESIEIDGKKYDVTQIGKRAFAGCKKLRKVVIKTKKLNKVGASCFKGIYKKAVIRVPKVKYKEYVKLLKRKGQKKGVNIRR